MLAAVAFDKYQPVRGQFSLSFSTLCFFPLNVVHSLTDISSISIRPVLLLDVLHRCFCFLPYVYLVVFYYGYWLRAVTRNLSVRLPVSTLYTVWAADSTWWFCGVCVACDTQYSYILHSHANAHTHFWSWHGEINKPIPPETSAFDLSWLKMTFINFHTRFDVPPILRKSKYSGRTRVANKLTHGMLIMYSAGW